MTLAEIADWQEETFGKVTFQRAVGRAKEEWHELEDKIIEGMRSESGVDAKALAYEVADVIIVLAGALRALSYDHAVDEKMAINKARKWKLRWDVTAYHIK